MGGCISLFALVFLSWCFGCYGLDCLASLLDD